MAQQNAYNIQTGQTGYLTPGQTPPSGWAFGAPPVTPTPSSQSTPVVNPKDAPGYDPTKDPTSSVYKRTLTDRYAEQTKSLDDNPAFNVPKPDEQAIRDSYRSNAQGTVDAIRSTFEKYINDDTIQKKALESKAYLTSLAGGLGGSPIGATHEADAAKQGQDQIEKTTQERDALIAKAYSDADLRATSDFKDKMAEYLGSSKDRYAEEQKIKDKIKTTAEQELATYASARTYDEFVKEAGQGKVQQYMNETGLDENGLKAYFLNKNKPSLLSDKPEIVGSKAIFFQKGTDGSIKQVSIDLPAGGGKIKDSRITDGGVQILYEDGTYKTVGTPGNDGAGGGSTLTKEQKTKLLGAGLGEADIPQFDKDVRTYGIDKAIEGLPENQRKAVREVYNAPDKTEFLNADYFKKIFTTDQLKAAAKDAGYTKGGFLGIGVGDQGVNDYLDHLTGLVDQYRKNGYTDQEILKMMQK